MATTDRDRRYVVMALLHGAEIRRNLGGMWTVNTTAKYHATWFTAGRAAATYLLEKEVIPHSEWDEYFRQSEPATLDGEPFEAEETSCDD